MKENVTFLVVFFLAAFFTIGCGEDDNNNTLSEHIRGSITATIHYPDGSTYDFVADTIAIAYLNSNSDSLVILGTDESRHGIGIYLENTNVVEGQTITPADVLGEEGFISFYYDYGGFPYILQTGANGQFGEDDRLTIEELNTTDQMISGTFELTTYPFLNDDPVAEDAISVSNGQFSLNYFNSPEQMQAYSDGLPDAPPTSPPSTLTISVSTTNNVLTMENQTITRDDPMATLAPSSPNNVLVLTVDMGNGYLFNLSCLPQTGTQTITELADEATLHILETAGGASSYQLWANEGTVTITDFDTTNRHAIGTYTASGGVINFANPDEEDYFTASGTFNVYYP